MTRRSLLSLILILCLGAGALSLATTGAVAVKHSAPAAGTKIKFPGSGVEVARLSGAQRKLEGVPRSFKRYVVKRLDEMFTEAGSAKRCATAPTVVIERFDSRGFASGGEGSYGPCPSGGYAVIYKLSGNRWEPVLGTQDVRYCQDLAFYDVTRFIAGRDCIDEDGKNVRYHLKQTAKASPEASARRIARMIGGFPIVPSEDVLSPAAEEQVAVIATTKGYVEVGTCVAAGDPDPLADELGGSDFGCSVTAYSTPEKKGARESFLLRMNDRFVVSELYRLT